MVKGSFPAQDRASRTIVRLLVILCLAAGSLAGAQQKVGATRPDFERVLIGSLDTGGWNGLTFLARAYGQQANFAIRFATRSGYFLVNGPEIPEVVREVGPHAPDESYARISWQVGARSNFVTLEWTKVDETTVLGRIKAPADYQLTLESYLPFASVSTDRSGQYALDQGKQGIVGTHDFDGVPGVTARFLTEIDAPVTSSGSFATLDALEKTTASAESLVDSSARTPSRNAAGLQANFGRSGEVHFVAMVGWNQEGMAARAKKLLNGAEIDATLERKRKAYEQGRPSSTGVFDQAAQIIGNNLFWNTIYAANRDMVLPTLSRSWVRDGWALGEWDGFFDSLLVSLESREQTYSTLRAVLMAQLENGVVPNDIGSGSTSPDRSEPPVGAYIVWKMNQRYPDKEFLAWAYPRLKRWHLWWTDDRGDGQPRRDGNRDGLLEWGSDRGSADSDGGRGFALQARWESGMDDSPMYDEAHYNEQTYTLDLDDVGLNSLYALDAESLAALADELGKSEDAAALRREYERWKTLVQQRLWNPQDGIYENRFWDGRFSPRLSPTNFYPMLAGIATPEQAKRMVTEHLLNEKEFWGQYVIPTAPRNDPAFGDQFYWRGNIWAPTNYLVWQALNRYGFDEEGMALARKGYELFLDDWTQNQHDDEQYHAWGGNGGGDKHYTWGALLCQIALEQFTDDNPWDGLRFGALGVTAAGQLRGAMWNGHVYDISIGPDGTKMARDGKERFRSDRPVVVRGYELSDRSLSFAVKSTAGSRVTLSEFDGYTWRVLLDGKAVRSAAAGLGSLEFAVPSGTHRVVAYPERPVAGGDGVSGSAVADRRGAMR